MRNDWQGRLEEATALQDHFERFRVLAEVTRDFVETANQFGSIIIVEKHCPAEEKTIKPMALGGVAGGEKFVCGNMLFKFAQDVELSSGS
jgi:hypothetical protein